MSFKITLESAPYNQLWVSIAYGCVQMYARSIVEPLIMDSPNSKNLSSTDFFLFPKESTLHTSLVHSQHMNSGNRFITPFFQFPFSVIERSHCVHSLDRKRFTRICYPYGQEYIYIYIYNLACLAPVSNCKHKHDNILYQHRIVPEV